MRAFNISDRPTRIVCRWPDGRVATLYRSAHELIYSANLDDLEPLLLRVLLHKDAPNTKTYWQPQWHSVGDSEFARLLNDILEPIAWEGMELEEKARRCLDDFMCELGGVIDHVLYRRP